MPEVLQDGGVYFNPQDSASIAKAVHRLVDSYELVSRSSQCRRLASNFPGQHVHKERSNSFEIHT